LIIINGGESSTIGNNRIVIQPRKIEGKANLTRDESTEEFKILEEANIASYDDSDYPPYIEVSFFLDTGLELLSALKEYAGTENDLIKIIVDCDFALLDSV
jgi:hypothetical protein